MSDIMAIVGGVLIDGNGFEPVEDSIVIVNGNPLRMIEVLENKKAIRLVMKEGKIEARND